MFFSIIVEFAETQPDGLRKQSRKIKFIHFFNLCLFFSTRPRREKTDLFSITRIHDQVLVFFLLIDFWGTNGVW